MVILSRHPPNCTPRSIDDFPSDLFTLEQRKAGAVIIHWLIGAYMIACIVFVCNRYFIPSLESICMRLKIQPDVAGATFMAAGGSAPELFTSLIAAIIAQSDVGLGTIVGSGVFNMYGILAACSLLAGQELFLNWWPILRDCGSYLISIVILIVVIHDKVVTWYESLIMVLAYLLYCVLQYFNGPIQLYLLKKINSFKRHRAESLIGSEKSSLVAKSFLIEEEPIIPEPNLPKKVYTSIWEVPDSFPMRVVWVAMLPAQAIFFITIPDCTRTGKLFMATFALSVIWLALTSYALVWMATIIGDSLGIPDTVMGLTVLAAGTSMPDVMASIIVSREGLGDMAVANCVGSNVFDLLLCLGLPWLIQTGMIKPDSRMMIRSNGMTLTSVILLFTSVFLIIVLPLNGWKLNRRFGCLSLSIYVVVITLTCMYEMNVFGQVNLPVCSR